MLRTLTIGAAEAVTRVAGGGGRLLVLAYHRVLPAPDVMQPDEPDVAQFRAHMQALRQDFVVLPLAEAVRRVVAGELPAGAVAVTFDDGYADNYTHALPVLREFGLTATFFVATGFLDGGWMFNDGIIEACRIAPAGEWDTGVPGIGSVILHDDADRRALVGRLIAGLKYQPVRARQDAVIRLLERARSGPPCDLMMGPAQVSGLVQAGQDIGCHTRHHPILARLSAEEAKAEIESGKSDLEVIAGRRLALFAYPNGAPDRDYGSRDVELLRRAGFEAAVTTAWGYADRSSDPLQIPRVAAWGDSLWRFSLRLARARAHRRGDGCAGIAVAPAVRAAGFGGVNPHA